MLDRTLAIRLARFFSALSDPTRLQIISLLVEPGAELSVQELAERLEMSHSAVSHQLRLLRRLRAVRVHPKGRLRLYSLVDEHVRTLYRDGLDHVLHD